MKRFALIQVVSVYSLRVCENSLNSLTNQASVAMICVSSRVVNFLFKYIFLKALKKRSMHHWPDRERRPEVERRLRRQHAEGSFGAG